MEDDVLKILRETFTDSITLPPSKLYQEGDLFKNKMEEFYYRMGALIAQQDVIKDLEYGLKDLFTSLYKDLMPEIVSLAEQLDINLDYLVETPFLIKAIRDFKNPCFGDLPLTIYYKFHYKGKAIIDDFPMVAEEIETTTDSQGKTIFVHEQLLSYTYYKFKHPLYAYVRIGELGVPDTIYTTEGGITLPDGILIFNELGYYKDEIPEPDFFVNVATTKMLVDEIKQFNVITHNGLPLQSIRVVSSNINDAIVTISGDTITVTAKQVTTEDVVITVSSTAITKTKKFYVNIWSGEEPVDPDPDPDADFDISTPIPRNMFLNDPIKGFSIALSGGLTQESIRVVSSNINDAIISYLSPVGSPPLGRVSGQITAKQVTSEDVVITISSTLIPKTLNFPITIKLTDEVPDPIAKGGWFSAYMGDFRDGMYKVANLDIRPYDDIGNHAKLTTEPADGVNIFLCGILYDEPAYNGDTQITFIMVDQHPFTTKVRYIPEQYLPVIGDSLTVKDGVAVAPGTGEVIPYTFITGMGEDSNARFYVTIRSERDATDSPFISKYNIRNNY